jgi:hypothetical protein
LGLFVADLKIGNYGAKEAAEKGGKDFLQGLKPIGYTCVTPGLKPRPPKETAFSATRQAKAAPVEIVGSS